MLQSRQAAKRLIVAVVGGTVLLAGVAMVALPGPAIIVIPAGLLILGSEFAWARRLLKRARPTEFGSEDTKPAHPSETATNQRD